MNYPFLLQVIISTVLISATTRADTPHPSKLGVLFEKETVLATEADGEAAVSNAYAKVREFIWRHWRFHIPGEIHLIGTTTEGDPYSAIYRIQSNSEGVWRILVQSRSAPDDAGEQRLTNYEACGVERVAFRSKAERDAARVPDDAELPPSRYRLVLKDRNGQVVVASL